MFVLMVVSCVLYVVSQRIPCEERPRHKCMGVYSLARVAVRADVVEVIDQRTEEDLVTGKAVGYGENPSSAVFDDDDIDWTVKLKLGGAAP